MNRKPNLTLISLIMIVALVLSACAQPTPAPQPTKAPEQPAPAAPTKAPEQPAPAAPEPTKAPEPVAPASKYKEAPMLAELVKAGQLPPVDQRLPENPLVVPVTESIGQYGGVLRRGFTGPADFNNYNRLVYDALVRFSPDGSKIEPKVAESWEVSSDFTTWTIKLRKGAKWSDGDPMDADDIIFWYEDVLLNKDLVPSVPAWMKSKDGSVAKVEKVDDYTVRWVYSGPAALFLTELANKDSGDRAYPVYLPSHYLKKFHPKYTPQAEIDKMVADAKFKTWAELFLDRAMPFTNPERPTMAAWVATSRISDPVFTLKRNPYFIGVDPEGNQLPYIDEIRFIFFQDTQTLNLAAIAGELDQQDRHMNLVNYPVLKENEAKGMYKVLTWPTFGGSDAAVFVNQTFNGDPEIADLLRVRDFRIALSYAINRSEIQESAFLGLGEIRQPVAAPWHPYYPGDEVAKKYTEYNPDEANKLLDAIGLDKRDAEGWRLLPSGKRLELELAVTPAFGPWPDVGQLITADWQKVGIRTTLKVLERALSDQLQASGELMVQIWNNDTTGFPFTGNSKFDPRKFPQPVFAPLTKKWYDTQGQEGVPPTPEIAKAVELIDKANTVGDEERAKIAQELFRLFVDNMFQIGTVGLTPMIQGVVVVNNNLHNVPTTLGNDWPLRTPGNARPEQWYFSK